MTKASTCPPRRPESVVAGVVVDVDDTLYLERDYVRSGFRAVGDWCRTELGVDGVGERAWELFTTGRRGTTLNDAMADRGIRVDGHLRDAVVGAYRRHTPDITLAPDARHFLRHVSALGRLGVITDGPAESQRAKCQALGLLDIAYPLVVTEEMGTSKPDPAVYQHVADTWGLPPHELVYVADNPVKDFLAPLALGWRTVRVRRRGSLHHDVPTPSGVVEVGDLHALDRFLN
jgi:putative hydrolase of the HAD superfamily